MGDTSVPGIEMSDINDGDILARTRENVNPNGLFQFIYSPDDGSDAITSDWVDQEHKKKLTRAWVDGVKSAIIGRAQSKLDEANAAREEERAKRIRDEQLAEEAPAQAPTRVAEPARRIIEVPSVRIKESPKSAATDPTSYVEDQLETARERLRAAEEMQKDVMREVLTARRDYEKWKALATALGGVDADAGKETGGKEVRIITSNSASGIT
jgi:hypothetical protein